MTTRAARTLILALMLTATGCGAPEVKGPPPPKGPGPQYAARCQEISAKHAASVASKTYLPAELLVHQWPATGGSDSTLTWLSEATLSSALTATGAEALQLKTALILARGGTGKSSLAESLEAQSCAAIPFYRIDLNSDVATSMSKLPSGVNAVVAAIAAQMGNPEPMQAEATLRDVMGDLPWVVVLDSLDETPLMDREALARYIDDLTSRVSPHVHALVMTRPPVFSSNYGIKTVQGRLELPVLTCEQSDEWLALNVTDAEEAKGLADFVKRYGIDTKVSSFERCHYPHMATYRDLQVVRALAKNAAIEKNNPDFKDFQNSRAQVYTYFATAQLIRDLQGGTWTPAEGIKTVDAMVAAKRPDGGQRNFQFRLEECIDVNALPDAPDKHSTCERLLQSSLFKARAQGDGIFHFANQSLGDLFLARWAAAQLVGLDGKPDCTRVEQKAQLLESNEVAGFLLGLQPGQACALELAQSLCRRGGYAQHIYEQFEQGLPSGKARVPIVVAAQEVLQPQSNPDLCVSGLFDGLAKTVEDLMPKKPEPVPALKAKKGSAKKGSAKKGK